MQEGTVGLEVGVGVGGSAAYQGPCSKSLRRTKDCEEIGKKKKEEEEGRTGSRKRTEVGGTCAVTDKVRNDAGGVAEFQRKDTHTSNETVL